jgi:hypothetical protein
VVVVGVVVALSVDVFFVFFFFLTTTTARVVVVLAAVVVAVVDAPFASSAKPAVAAVATAATAAVARQTRLRFRSRRSVSLVVVIGILLAVVRWRIATARWSTVSGA